jgi:putative DNA primase/helicase
MNFERFAELHGLIIDHLVVDKWTRCSTKDHPHKKNGSYIFEGNKGAVQNWATHEKPVQWRSSEEYKPDPQWQQKKMKADSERKARHEKSAKKAGWMMHQTKKATHPYLAKKGFPNEKGYVFDQLLLIPMRKDGELVGCQMIDLLGNKRFLTGQITKGASAVFDAKGKDLVCEGYATALSVRKAMKHLGIRYKIHVAFSASNMLEIAKDLDCIVIADNDPVGVKTAKQIGKHYWVSDTEGEDFNDMEIRVGVEQISLTLAQLLNKSDPLP